MICFIDCETTGLSPEKNAIHEVTFFIPDLEQIKTFHIHPYNRLLDFDALEMSGAKLSQVASYPKLEIVLPDILEFLYGFELPLIPAGYGVSFDLRFLSVLFEILDAKLTDFFDIANAIDVLKLAKETWELESYALENVARAITPDIADETTFHTSRDDAVITYRLYQECENA
jgi:DNA polymerase III epsilon subunit-like protein